eukprot:gene3402-biopygen11267
MREHVLFYSWMLILMIQLDTRKSCPARIAGGQLPQTQPIAARTPELDVVEAAHGVGAAEKTYPAVAVRVAAVDREPRGEHVGGEEPVLVPVPVVLVPLERPAPHRPLRQHLRMAQEAGGSTRHPRNPSDSSAQFPIYGRPSSAVCRSHPELLFNVE